MTDTWWFVPIQLLAAYNLFTIYRLGAPNSIGSRVARTLGIMASLLTLFSLFELQFGVDFLHELAYVTLFAAYAIQNGQFFYEERRSSRHPKPKKFVETLVQIEPKPNGASK